MKYVYHKMPVKMLPLNNTVINKKTTRIFCASISIRPFYIALRVPRLSLYFATLFTISRNYFESTQ